LDGKEYFPQYQFYASYEPLLIIGKVLESFCPVADTWRIAAWFHYPNGYIVESRPEGVAPVAPKDAPARRDDVLNAIGKRAGTYFA
jgi:hypothetical protein